MTADVVIVGGGVAGAACARELATHGRSVLVLDGDSVGGPAWRAAAGMLAAQIESNPHEPLFDLALASRERTLDLARSLMARTGIDIGAWREGILHVASSESAVPGLRTQVGWHRQRSQPCEWLDARDVVARWPHVGPTFGGLWALRDGAIDPERYVQALRKDAEHAGAQFVAANATEILCDGEGIAGVVADRRYAARAVVIANGAWSGTLAGLPRPVSVEPVRGQMIAFPWPASVPRSIIYGDHGYVLWRDGEAIVGSTMETAGFRVDVAPTTTQRLATMAGQLLPDLAGRTPVRAWAGLRPMTPDSQPIIGAEPAAAGLWFATGHGRNGVLLAAITGHLIRQLMDGEEPELDIAPFSPTRFWRW
jgi:glycine oxidase